MQNDIFSIILIYEDNLRFYQVFVLNRQIITDWTQMTHMFSGQIKYGPTEVLVASRYHVHEWIWTNLNEWIEWIYFSQILQTQEWVIEI